MGRPHELFQFVNFDFHVERDERGYYSINWREYQEYLKAGAEEDLPAVPEKPYLGRPFGERPIHVSVAQYLQAHRKDAVFSTLLKHQEYLRRVLDQVSRGETLSEPTLLTIFEHAPRMYNAVIKRGERFEEVFVAEDYFDTPYWDFQRLYFHGDLTRVRRCFQCGKFFYDGTEEKKAHFCSEDCEARGVAVPETLPEKAQAERRDMMEKEVRGEAAAPGAPSGQGKEEQAEEKT